MMIEPVIMTNRAAILIDGSNLYLSAKRYGVKVWPPDIEGLIRPVLKKPIDAVCKIHYFISYDKSNPSQMRALNSMQRSGVIVHEYRLKYYPDQTSCQACNIICQNCGRDLRQKPHKEKMIDIAIVTELLELAFQTDPDLYETFIVVSGDKDLIPAIRLVRERMGKDIVIAGFRDQNPALNSLAYELDKEADQIINLKELLGL
jgi:uncharacterized LabA/DUF88 family protein